MATACWPAAACSSTRSTAPSCRPACATTSAASPSCRRLGATRRLHGARPLSGRDWLRSGAPAGVAACGATARPPASRARRLEAPTAASATLASAATAATGFATHRWAAATGALNPSAVPPTMAALQTAARAAQAAQARLNRCLRAPLGSWATLSAMRTATPSTPRCACSQTLGTASRPASTGASRSWRHEKRPGLQPRCGRVESGRFERGRLAASRFWLVWHCSHHTQPPPATTHSHHTQPPPATTHSRHSHSHHQAQDTATTSHHQAQDTATRQGTAATGHWTQPPPATTSHNTLDTRHHRVLPQGTATGYCSHRTPGTVSCIVLSLDGRPALVDASTEECKPPEGAGKLHRNQHGAALGMRMRMCMWASRPHARHSGMAAGLGMRPAGAPMCSFVRKGSSPLF
eukprot:351244-Chlamydomonas_euryale.AAC.1